MPHALIIKYLFWASLGLWNLSCSTESVASQERSHEREQMVQEQIFSRGVRDLRTLAALKKVPRHQFIPSSEQRKAYQDRPLPIGHGQTISQPYIVAYMTETIGAGPGVKILEIGTGSGYQAAILAETGAEVYTIEIIKELAHSAYENLRDAGYEQVETKQADGYFGWPEHAPFDAIIVTAAAEFIPPPLIAQLKVGGRMVIPVGSPFFVQTLLLIQKNPDQSLTSTNLMPVRFVPFRRTE